MSFQQNNRPNQLQLGGAFDIAPSHFGVGLFFSYVIVAARWARGTTGVVPVAAQWLERGTYRENNKPHYWDDFWGLASLWGNCKTRGALGSRRKLAKYGRPTADSKKKGAL